MLWQHRVLQQETIYKCFKFKFIPGKEKEKEKDKQGDIELACERAPYLFQVSPTSSLPLILHATPVSSDDIPSHYFAAGLKLPIATQHV